MVGNQIGWQYQTQVQDQKLCYTDFKALKARVPGLPLLAGYSDS